MNRVLIVITLILFGGLTAVAVWTDGIVGIFSSIVSSFGSAQIFVDLVIALVLVSVWMWQDAKATGRNPLPWIVATILVGSFSPLLYLLTRKSSEQVPKDS
ncbi:hypothetical protein AB3R30_22845 [Leptolyngbyaceae cyanobacterium UHCC 1019]